MDSRARLEKVAVEIEDEIKRLQRQLKLVRAAIGSDPGPRHGPRIRWGTIQGRVVEILRAADEPLHVREIERRLLDAGAVFHRSSVASTCYRLVKYGLCYHDEQHGSTFGFRTSEPAATNGPGPPDKIL